MKTITRVIVLVTLCLFPAVSSYAGFQDGYELMRGWDAYRAVETDNATDLQAIQSAAFIGYVSGVIDSMDGRRFSIPRVKAGVLLLIVGTYLKNHSDELEFSGHLLVSQALAEVYPIPK